MGVRQVQVYPSHLQATSIGVSKPPHAQQPPVQSAQAAASLSSPRDVVAMQSPAVEAGETEDEEEECWEADLDDLDSSLWVPPRSRPDFFSAEVQLSENGDLGLVLKHRGCRRRSRSNVSRLGFPNSGIQLAAFSVDRNPNVEALAASGELPMGATLALFNGQIVKDAQHFVELVQIARHERSLRLEHVQAVAPENVALLRFHVSLGFVLPRPARGTM